MMTESGELTNATSVLELHVPPDARLIAQVRHALRDTLEGRACPAGLDVLQLAISELMANAVEYAHLDITVRLRQRGTVVRIEVDDDGPGWPVLVPADPWATTGRGLRILDRTSLRWGVDLARPDGKTVWAEFSC